MNKKGGMTDVEFEKYIDTSIVPLFPELEDTKGKRVLLKVDSGSGRNGRDLLMKCRFCGLYVYPSLPNATSMQQETDRNNNTDSYLCSSLVPRFALPAQLEKISRSCVCVPHPNSGSLLYHQGNYFVRYLGGSRSNPKT